LSAGVGVGVGAGGSGGSDPGSVIANEFAEVTVRRVPTHNGVRLEIRSARLGRSILLDAVQLESLTWQDPALFSELLVDPFGPSPSAPSPSPSPSPHAFPPASPPPSPLPQARTNGSSG